MEITDQLASLTPYLSLVRKYNLIQISQNTLSSKRNKPDFRNFAVADPECYGNPPQFGNPLSYFGNPLIIHAIRFQKIFSKTVF